MTIKMVIFKDRQSAGKLLAKRLTHFTDDRRLIVLGIPRGGVVVAAEIAKQLQLPLDIIVTRKIGAPNQKELALGAVDADGEVVWDRELLDQLRIDNGQLTIEEVKEEIKRRETTYRQGREALNIEGKTIILTDDGIATGATILAAIRFLRRHKVKKIALAVPVASKESVERVSKEIGEIGEIVVLETPEYFQAVGQFYQYFEEVSDEEVIQLLHHER